MSIKNGFVNIPSLSVTQEELERVAEEIGVNPEYLIAVVSYADLLRREAAERKLDPSQMMSVLLDLMGESLMYYDPKTRTQMCEDLFQQLLEGIEVFGKRPAFISNGTVH